MRAWLSLRSVVVAFVACTAGVGCKDVANKTYCDGTAEFVCSDPAKPACDVATKTCVAGLVDGDMGGDGSVDKDMPNVDGPTGVDMVPGPDLLPMCKESSECTVASAPVCGADGKCRACEGSGDDAVCVAKGAHVCITTGANDGQCGECDPLQANVENTTCTGSKSAAGPICDATGHCVKCTAHAQCNSKVCDFVTGACADPSTVAYVNNFGLASSTDECVDTLHDSAPPGKPYCQVTAAISVSGKSILRVAGSLTPYTNFAISNRAGTVTIIGPGKDATPPAQLFATSQISVDVKVESGQDIDSVLVLDGLVIGGTDASKANRGIRCVNDAAPDSTLTVNVKDSRIEYSVNDGVNASDCAVTIGTSIVDNHTKSGVLLSGGSLVLSQSTITANRASGIEVGGTSPTVSIVNTLVSANGKLNPSGSTYGGLRIGAGNATIVNTTIVDNLTATSRYTGIDGDGAESIIGLNVVIAGGQGGTMDVRGVTLGNSAFAAGGTPSNGNKDISACQLDTIFSDPAMGNYQPERAATTAECTLIDVGAASFMSVNAPTVDYDNAVRPQGAGNDIGAYEAAP